MDPFTLRQTIRELIEPTVERLGFDLVAIEWVGQVLRVSIDAPYHAREGGRGGGEHEQPGVTAGGCARVSRAIEPLLDAADPISSSYTLEVSSPGIERPVQRPQDFERFKGYTLRVRLEPGPPRRRYTGEIIGLAGHELTLSADGEEHTLHLDMIERAHLVLTVEEYLALGQGLPQSRPQEDSDDHQ